MKHYIYLSVAFLIFSITTASFAQTGEITGKVIDKKSKSRLSFATVTAELNGIIVAGAQADVDGKYSIKPLTPGRYNVKAEFNGYQSTEVRGVFVISGKFSDVTLEIRQDTLERKIIIK